MDIDVIRAHMAGRPCRVAQLLETGEAGRLRLGPFYDWEFRNGNFEWRRARTRCQVHAGIRKMKNACSCLDFGGEEGWLWILLNNLGRDEALDRWDFAVLIRFFCETVWQELENLVEILGGQEQVE